MNKRAFVKNTAVMTLTSLLLRTLGIVFRIFISNRVGAEGMGLYQLVFAVYVLGTTFAATGLSTAVTCLVAEHLTRRDQRAVRRIMSISLWLSVGIGILSAAILYVGAPLIGQWMGDTRAVPAIRISGLALPFIGCSGCIKGYFTARRRAAPPCVSQIVEQVVRIGSILLLLYAAGDSCSIEDACRIIILGDALSETVAFGYLSLCYRKDRRTFAPTPLPTASGPPLFRPLMHIALPLTAGRYLATALRTVENVLVPARLTLFTGAASLSLAQYGAVKGMALPLVFFPSAFLMTVAGLLIPELADAHALGQRRQVARITALAVRMTVAGGLLIGCVFTVLGKSLGRYLYGDDTVGLYLQILGPLTPVMYMDSVASGMLKGLGEQVHALWYGVADSVVRIGLIIVLLPRWGITGFLFVMLMSNLLTACLNTHRLLTVSDCRMRWGRWVCLPTGIAILSGVLGTIGINYLPEGLLSIGGIGLSIAVVYPALTLVCRCFTRDDLLLLQRRKASV